jgi:hypothetical protein
MVGSDYLQKYTFYYPISTGLSQTQIIDRLNTARSEIYLMLREYPVVSTFPFVANQSDYTIPSNLGIIAVWWIYNSNLGGMYVRTNDLKRIQIDNFPLLDYSIGYPLAYAILSPTSIRLYPTPSTASLTGYIRYISPLTTVYTPQNLPMPDTDINSKYGELVAIKLAALIALQDQNLNDSQFLEQLLLKKASRMIAL